MTSTWTIPMLAIVALVLMLATLAVAACGYSSDNTVPSRAQSNAPKVSSVPVSPTPVTVYPTSVTESASAEYQPANVVRVIDGDTIEVDIDGTLYTIRYIGIDTPETKHPTRGVEFYGPEATDRNRQLVEGKTVYLEKDISETDKYGRLLRYVFVDGAMVNALLVEEGFAQVTTYPPDVKYADLFLDLQRNAKQGNLGLWSVTETVYTSKSSDNCDPAYPTVCIQSKPPDLDCSDISYRRFKVLPADPHKFDGDKDGVGCESQ